MQPDANNQPNDDEIDLRQLVTVLWKQKILIAGIGILGAALGGGASILSTRYVSEGLFQTPGAMLSTLAYSPCEPYGKRVKWRSLSH